MIWVRQKNGDLTWFNQGRGQKHQQILSVPSLGLKKPKITRRKIFRQLFAKNMGNLAQVKKKR